MLCDFNESMDDNDFIVKSFFYVDLYFKFFKFIMKSFNIDNVESFFLNFVQISDKISEFRDSEDSRFFCIDEFEFEFGELIDSLDESEESLEEDELIV